MEFVEAMKIHARICQAAHGVCRDCVYRCYCARYKTITYAKEAEAILQKWADEHMIATNIKKMEQVFGHGKMFRILGPAERLSIEVDGKRVCFRDWLNAEYKEPELDVTDNNVGKMEAENVYGRR